MLNEYIDNPEQYETYELAEEAESYPHMWVDSLSDNHIEIHACDCNGEMFCNELTDFINNNIESSNIQMKNERLFINKMYINLPYAIITNIKSY
jgi:hypothetical protein